jgi:hypothetical protein
MTRLVSAAWRNSYPNPPPIASASARKREFQPYGKIRKLPLHASALPLTTANDGLKRSDMTAAAQKNAGAVRERVMKAM